MSGLRRTQGGGQPLPPKLSATASQALGQDLSPVRVHTGPEAAALAGSVQAVAFATGNDIYFSEGSYRPTEAVGQQLIAHELGHIGQAASAGGTIGRADDPAEAEADRAATRVVAAQRRQTVPSPLFANDYHDHGKELRRSLTANDTTIGDGGLQSTAGNQLSRWSLETLRRAPEPVVPVPRVEQKKGDERVRTAKPIEGTKYKDDDYAGLDLEFQDYSVYKIMNPGERHNTFVYYADDQKYYAVDATTMEADDNNVVDMAAVDGVVAAVLTSRKAGENPVLVERPEKASEDLVISGLIMCVGIVVEARDATGIKAAAGAHFVTPTSITDNTLNENGRKCLNENGRKYLERQLDLVRPYGELTARLLHVTGASTRKTGDQRDADDAATLITTFLMKNGVKVVERSEGASTRTYRLQSDGDSEID